MLTAMLLWAGCQSPSNESGPKLFGWPGEGKAGRKAEIDPTKIETRDDVVQISQYWPQMPWLQEGSRIVGFKVTVYFVSGQTEKGVFVPGNIFVWLYELVPMAGGRREKKLAYVWEFDEAESMGFRVTKRAIGGYFYGFPLRWPRELALEGKRTEIQFGYERTDKQVVLGSPKIYRVPVPIGYQPPAEKTEP